MNIQKNINKLLIAIRLKGIDIKIDTFEYYSEKLEKYCKKYVIYIKQWTKNRKNEDVYKYVYQDGFSSKILLLKWLAKKYKEGEANGR